MAATLCYINYPTHQRIETSSHSSDSIGSWVSNKRSRRETLSDDPRRLLNEMGFV